ncbi:MAG: hypothetical protein ACRDLN_08170 [Solirubrobacteraceae bacterium]
MERVAAAGSRPSSFGAPSGGADGDGTPPAGGRGGLRVPVAPLALGGAIAAVVATVAVVLLTGGDADGGGGGAGGGREPTTPDTPRSSLSADPPVASLTRPLSLAFRGDDLVVLSGDGFLRAVDADRATETRWGMNVGGGANDVAAGFGSLWVTKHNTGSLLKIDPRTRHHRKPSGFTRSKGRPVAVATGEGAVWVATNEGTGPGRCEDEGSGPGHVNKVTPQGTVTKQIPVDGKICDIAVGYRAVWVTTSSPSAVVRIPVQGGEPQTIEIRGKPHGLAIGEGAVWVADHGDRSITRIGRRTWRREPRSVALEYEPERVAVGGGSVWVTARRANQLIRIDPRRRTRESISTGIEPYAVGVHRGRVWLTLLGKEQIQRVRFTG